MIKLSLSIKQNEKCTHLQYYIDLRDKKLPSPFFRSVSELFAFDFSREKELMQCNLIINQWDLSYNTNYVLLNDAYIFICASF